ncbi:MAG: FkbM family methyltransferase [Gammaproteobacteria bacterium]|nr:FkbM family methyltransferase [Gammaproteobacteria bacterium]MCI0591627.1 FkbM family methyltransferase [Gammaproteobacteria bacterium]
MQKQLKHLGKRLSTIVNLSTTRTLNNKKIYVPIINGVKVGVSGEKWMSELLGELFQFADGVFYDVGANLGQTLAKVSTLDASRQYVGFEPNPSCLFYLQRLISSNLWNQAMIVPVGLSNMDGIVELSGSSDTDGGSTIIKDLRSIPQGRMTKFVPVFRYEAICGCLPKDKAAIIKIDVEGAELEVIETMSPLIDRDQPIIIMEILPTRSEDEHRAIRNEKLLSALRSLKYMPYRICKTSNDTYAGITRIDNIGGFTDPTLKDHIFVPLERTEALECVLTIASTRTA